MSEGFRWLNFLDNESKSNEKQNIYNLNLIILIYLTIDILIYNKKLLESSTIEIELHIQPSRLWGWLLESGISSSS